MENMTISGESNDYRIVRSLNLLTVVTMVCNLTKPGLACSCFLLGRTFLVLDGLSFSVYGRPTDL